MPLASCRYGKARIRIMRLDRGGERHVPRELDVQVMLEGAFEASWTEGDNRAVVATDTLKNIVGALAADHVEAEAETFAQAVARFLLDRYDQVSTVAVTTAETRWSRLVLDGAPHPHGFVLDGNGRPTAWVEASRNATVTRSGVRGFTVLKTTQAGWSGFHADEFRTLPDTTDRLVGTSLDAAWSWDRAPDGYEAANARLVEAMTRTFVEGYSPGVQHTMYRMGEAALAAVPEVGRISLAMPNKHYVPMDLSAFGRDAAGRVLLPTDEPHGLIEAVVARA